MRPAQPGYGPDDERGALNLVGPDVVLRGLRAVQWGEVIPLGLPIVAGGGPHASIRAPMQHFMIRDGGDYAAGLSERAGFGYSDDSILLATQGTTHLDALAHVWQDGRMYNGYPANTVTSRGAAKCGIDKAGPFVTRGLLVDADPDGAASLGPGDVVTEEVVRELLRLDGLEPQPGDALLIRTGWLRQWRAGNADTDSWPGLDPGCAPWLAECGVAVVGADNLAVEPCPSPVADCAVPLHIALIRDRGVYLLELLDLEALAATGVHEFLLVVAPLRIAGGTASPVAPVAVI